MKGLPGFEEVRPKDCDYVLEEAGFARQSAVYFDEFVEVCAPPFLPCLFALAC